MPRSKRTIFQTKEAPKVEFLEAALEDAVQAGGKEMATLEKISSKNGNESAPSASLPNAG